MNNRRDETTMAEDQASDQALVLPAVLPMDAAFTDIAGQLSTRSRRIYRHDLQVFATWMLEQGLTPETLTRSNMIAYRVSLQATYAKSTAGRMLSVVRRLMHEQVERLHLASNPASDVRGFTGTNESPHVALTQDEAQNLLDAIDTKTLRGQRDYVLLLFLLRTGVRRSEAAALTIADLSMQQGHHIATIQHGKGDKRRIVKVPVEVWRDLDAFGEARRQYHATRLEQLLSALDAEREQLGNEAYQHRRATLIAQHTMTPQDGLFVRFRRGDHPTREAMTDKAIELVVKQYAKKIEADGLTPHGLRASFITLALEANAPLHKVQYAVGHSDPRTTEHYQKRKLNLGENAADYVKVNRRRSHL